MPVKKNSLIRYILKPITAETNPGEHQMREETCPSRCIKQLATSVNDF